MIKSLNAKQTMRRGWGRRFSTGKAKETSPENVPRSSDHPDNGEQNATPGYESNYDGDSRTQPSLLAIPHDRPYNFLFVLPLRRNHYSRYNREQTSQFTKPFFFKQLRAIARLN